MRNPFLVGRHVYLRPHFPDDAQSDWAQWFNDAEANRFLYHGIFPNTPELQARFLVELQERQAAQSHLQLAIVHRESDTLIGVCSLGSIDWVNRTAEIGMVIGPPQFRGRTNGLEAMALLMYHGFGKMNLNRIWAGQHVGLRRWKETLERQLAFATEGVKRQAMLRDGQYHDVVMIAAIADDWFPLVQGAGGTLDGLLDVLQGTATSAAAAPR